MREKGQRVKSKLILAAIMAAPVLGMCGQSMAAFFGPGRLGLSAGGAISGNPETLLDSATEQFAMGFTALTSGDLSSFSFASGASTNNLDYDNTFLTVAIYADNGGKPGTLLGTGTSTFNAKGGRARSASFTGLTVTAGTNYFAVISSTKASSTSNCTIGAYGLNSAGTPRLNTPDMNQVNSGYRFLHSTDNGSSWTTYANAVGVHAVTIGGTNQGFAYTGYADATRIYKTTTGASQFIDQTFTFQTYDAANPIGELKNLQISLRPSGTYANTTTNVLFRIANASDLSVVAEQTKAVTLGAAANFVSVSVDMTGVSLTSGQDYVLFIGTTDGISANTGSDFIFARSYSWGLGDPSLGETTFGGGAATAYMTSSMDSVGTKINSTRVDLPFMLEYTATPPATIPEPAALGGLAVCGLVSLMYRRRR